MGNTWKIALATVVIFGAGVVIGGVLVRYTEDAKPARSQHTVPLWPPPRGLVQGRQPEAQQNLERQQAEFIRGLQRELKLTREQRDRIDRTIRDGQERSKAIWSKVAPELHKEMEEVKDRIRTELTPEQRARFEEVLKQRQHRRLEESQGAARGARLPRDARPPPANPPSPDRP